MAEKKVTKTKPGPRKVTQRFKADHDRPTNKKKCSKTILRGTASAIEKKNGLNVDCVECGAKKAHFVYDGEVTAD